MIIEISKIDEINKRNFLLLYLRKYFVSQIKLLFDFILIAKAIFYGYPIAFLFAIIFSTKENKTFLILIEKYKLNFKRNCIAKTAYMLEIPAISQKMFLSSLIFHN